MVIRILKNFKIITLVSLFLLTDFFLSLWFILDWKPILLQKFLMFGEFESEYRPLSADHKKMTESIGGYIKKVGVGYIEVSYGNSKEKRANLSKDTLFFEGQIRQVDPNKLKLVYQVPNFSTGDYVMITFIKEDSIEITKAILLER